MYHPGNAGTDEFLFSWNSFVYCSSSLVHCGFNCDKPAVVTSSGLKICIFLTILQNSLSDIIKKNVKKKQGVVITTGGIIFAHMEEEEILRIKKELEDANLSTDIANDSVCIMFY